MGLFDKFLEVMNLQDEEDEEFDDYGEYEDEVEEAPAPKKAAPQPDPVEKTEPTVRITERTSRKPSNKVTPMRTARNNSQPMEVCVFKPSSYEDSREICETLLSGQTVILNMEGVDVGLAQRIIDFSSGACYAIDGNLQKISNYIFVLTPSSIGISGDLQEIVNAFDFSGIQTGF